MSFNTGRANCLTNSVLGVKSPKKNVATLWVRDVLTELLMLLLLYQRVHSTVWHVKTPMMECRRWDARHADTSTCLMKETVVLVLATASSVPRLRMASHVPSARTWRSWCLTELASVSISSKLDKLKVAGLQQAIEYNTWYMQYSSTPHWQNIYR